MNRTASPFVAGLLAVASLAASANARAAECGPAALAAPPTIIVAAPEMRTPSPIVGACLSLSAQAFVDRARALASAAASQGAYVPLTKDDNTPWRFDMNQNGRRMTAEEFDAWMKAKGIRVATGKAPAAAPPPPATESQR